jgi:protein-arginine kinase activator protein McsA
MDFVKLVLKGRNQVAIKEHCDICDKVLTKKIVDRPLFSGYKHKHWVITEMSYLFNIVLPPMGNNWSRKKMVVCEECVEDFKEFVQRKKVVSV